MWGGEGNIDNESTPTYVDDAIDIINGAGGADSIHGGGGDDILNGDAGNDTIFGGDGGDTLNGGADNDTLSGGAGTNTLLGGLGDDTLTSASTSVNDVLDGGTGGETATGGDTATLDRTTQTIALTLALDDNVVAQVPLLDGTLIKNIEKLNYTGGSGVDTISGLSTGNYADTIRGANGNDVLWGYGGADTLYGGVDATSNTANGDDEIHGGNDSDNIHGGGGNDTLFGDAGTDSIFGGDGNDTLNAGDGSVGGAGDILRGGKGNDTLNGSDGNDQLWGGEGNIDNESTPTYVDDAIDIINGAGGADSIHGGGGDDILNGDAGNDTIFGGDGGDTLNGGADNDTLSGGAGTNTLLGGLGDDTLTSASTSVNDVLDGGTGGETATGGDTATLDRTTQTIALTLALDDNVVAQVPLLDGTLIKNIEKLNYTGGSGVDTISGLSTGNYADTIRGKGGNDVLSGGDGVDQLLGGVGDDILDGGAGNDTLFGGDSNSAGETGTGNDTLLGGAGIDQLFGGDGDDQLFGEADGDQLNGGSGNDTLDGGSANDNLNGADGNDNLIGSDGADSLVGGNGDDTLDGGVGQDLLQGETGNDTLISVDQDFQIIGGAGTDFLLVERSTAATGQTFVLNNQLTSLINLADGTTVTQIEQVEFRGGSGNDTLTGGALNDTLSGNGGTDVLVGGGGDDVLDGGLGINTLTGGAGNDTLDGALGSITNAAFSGTFSNYQVTRLGNGRIQVTDQRAGSPDGTDNTGVINLFQFSDRNYSVPTAANGSATSNEDIAINSTVTATDLDGDTLTYTTATGPAHGTVTWNSGGNYTYTPASNFYGADSFTYKVNDGTLDSLTATVSLTINPINDAPVNAVPSAQTMDEDTSLNITGLGVSDVDSGVSPITVTLAVGHGVLNVAAGTEVIIANNGTGNVSLTGEVSAISAALTAANAVSYTSAQDYAGSDTLTMQSNDGGNFGAGGALSDSDTVAITINPINDAPVNTVPGAQTTDEDTNLVVSGLSVADVDSGSNSISMTLSVANGILTIQEDPSVLVTDNGTASVTVSGTVADINALLALASAVAYSPALDYNGGDTLTVLTDDGGNTGAGGALSDSDTVAITINPINDAPIANADTGSAIEAGAIPGGNATGNVLANDTDVDAGDTKTVNAVNGLAANVSVPIAGTYGTVTLNGDGSYTYVVDNANAFVQALNAGSTPLTESFDYTVTDTAGATSLSTLTISINGANDAPTITSNAAITIDENIASVTIVSASDVDNTAEQLSYSISGGADAALFTVNSETGALAFAAAPNFESSADAGGNNVYDVIVQVSDGALTDTQAIAVTVNDRK